MMCPLRALRRDPPTGAFYQLPDSGERCIFLFASVSVSASHLEYLGTFRGERCTLPEI